LKEASGLFFGTSAALDSNNVQFTKKSEVKRRGQAMGRIKRVGGGGGGATRWIVFFESRRNLFQKERCQGEKTLGGIQQRSPKIYEKKGGKGLRSVQSENPRERGIKISTHALEARRGEGERGENGVFGSWPPVLREIKYNKECKRLRGGHLNMALLTKKRY